MIKINITVDDCITKKPRSVEITDQNYNSDIKLNDLMDLLKDALGGLGYIIEDLGFTIEED